MSRLPQIPPNPDTITQASLDSPQGWMDYPLRADVIVGDPKCRAKVLRTVGTVTPYKAVSFFTAQPSRFHWRFDNDEAFVVELADGKIGGVGKVHNDDVICAPSGWLCL